MVSMVGTVGGMITRKDVISALDLTCLKASDNEASIRALCEVANHGEDGARCAAVCVHSDLVLVAREHLDGGINLACVAGGFPHARMSMGVKLAEIEDALAQGADEVDVVLDLGAFFSGEYAIAESQIAAMCDLVHEREARIKVIVESGEFDDDEELRAACQMAIAAGADWLKTSTGFSEHGANPHSVRILAQEAAKAAPYKLVGVKASGGVRTFEQAKKYMEIVAEEGGEEALAIMRIGGSKLPQ